MTTDNLQTDSPEKTSTTLPKRRNSKILNFDDDKGSDINLTISKLDNDLAQLRLELSTISASVDEGLDRLGDADTRLTAKVSETYKCLGTIGNAYKSLLNISSRIDKDLRVLNSNVSDAAKQITSDLNSSEKATCLAADLPTDQAPQALLQENQQLVSSVDQLKETSRLSNETIRRSIQETTEKMLSIEKNVLSQIEDLTDTSQKTSESITKTVEINSAKILKLQSVDEAIIRRATTMEITAAELTARGQDIDNAVEQLQLNIDALNRNAKKLNGRTNALEAIANHHDVSINGLQKKHAVMTRDLTLLASRVKRDFGVTLTGLSVLLVLSSGLFLYQKKLFENNEVKVVTQSQNPVGVVNVIQPVDEVRPMPSKAELVTENRLAALEEKMRLVSKHLMKVQDRSKSIEAHIDKSIDKHTVKQVDRRTDQSVLLDPKNNNDSSIHGPGWITRLPAGNFVIQLAYVDNRDLIDGIAQTYEFQLQGTLKNSLSYFVANDKNTEKYILLAGNYADIQQARSAMQLLPHHREMQKPVIRKVGNIQKYIIGSGAV